ncbi:hypothetical protein THRCLA_22470 [Thraustotheca clavata]|uniref:Uncharacterized protein n=1 Tax=Thraustotheca clavata TaxID=74557 RepID=A0A1V9Z053_9STRA|nr:hypothetical protein THRCLA_22470 [Thraustotheca clavata]
MDVFAGLDPLGGKGTGGVKAQNNYATPPKQGNIGMGLGPNGLPINPVGMPGINPNGMLGMNYNSMSGINPAGMPINPAGMPGVNPVGLPGINGAWMPGMNPNGMPGISPNCMPGMNPLGMAGMNPNGMMNMPMGGGMMPPAPVAQPVMYDSIKNLLEKKAPAAVSSEGGGGDMFSCFGGENKAGSRTNSGSQVVCQTPTSLDPFGGNASTNSAANLSIFGDTTPSTSGNISTSSSTPKNNALADRLRSKRQTQEAQRATLNVGTYASSNAATTATPSIKKQLGGETNTSTPTVPSTNPDNLLGF